ncbi:Altered inheritance of mitochondria protein 32 [Aspergillus alliaceus]|uniref:Altered inheritance of mitochondria protein 32 n=1 Tax=Petromyces alliaceus TaxID=209559 RepID=A0A5N7CHW6_PETAA|nr:Sucrase/ferredoxin-like-domain-containing protein [Aspergillus alliaceus]KAB8231159.1 Sucrase/ferredoxin-like-domain-containing protein [Aspergillus alliaceus]KAE8393751.1 Sucrase/ferredoxin-like-domain-containing protein [Aspergillus alliaceus]KAF5864105.1 Altered inheritance of mitochondria protein 32 [Aspergillus burnettii]
MFRSFLSITGLATPDYIFPSVDPKIDGEDCRQDCADCTVRWPAKVKVDTTLPMYGHIKQFHAHVLVATGKTDWVQKVEHEKGSLMEAFKSDGGKSKNGRVMISASNLSPPDEEVPTSGKTSVLLLPSFTFVDGVGTADVKHVIDSFIDNPSQAGKSHLTSRPCPHDYVVLLCSHQRRDARCGITAPLIKKELERQLRGHGLYRDLDDERPGGVGIYFVSHVGGHKFAANVLIYRKKEQQMIWLGRVKPEHCEGVVKYTILQGKVVHPDSQLRGGFDRMKGMTSW